MTYFLFLMGLALVITFGWLLKKHVQRDGRFTLYHLEMIVGILAGLYLIITSGATLLS